MRLQSTFNPSAEAVIYKGDCQKLLRQIPDEAIQLIITSPPYNVGKSYEAKQSLARYLEEQEPVIEQSTSPRL